MLELFCQSPKEFIVIFIVFYIVMILWFVIIIFYKNITTSFPSFPFCLFHLLLVLCVDIYTIYA